MPTLSANDPAKILYKVDRRKNKKTTDWTAYHQTHIDRWNQFEANRMPDNAMHNRNYRSALRLAWTLTDILDDLIEVEEQNKYDTSTHRGSTVGMGPVRDKVTRELIRTVNDAGVALGMPPSSQQESSILRNALQGRISAPAKMALSSQSSAPLQLALRAEPWTKQISAKENGAEPCHLSTRGPPNTGALFGRRPTGVAQRLSAGCHRQGIWLPLLCCVFSLRRWTSSNY
uniref:Uncharacterized protein n=1 Tax=Oryza sativa subsp. japonica TaxID=39947 RepID=Q2RBD7_ORYSJ|nr:hypothetical protein LOC_Os11g02340 [Oryza sativa Japonica Group]